MAYRHRQKLRCFSLKEHYRSGSASLSLLFPSFYSGTSDFIVIFVWVRLEVTEKL